MNDNLPLIEWTIPKLNELKKAYAHAKSNHYVEFTFEGHAFLISYTKYLIEHLENLLESQGC